MQRIMPAGISGTVNSVKAIAYVQGDGLVTSACRPFLRSGSTDSPGSNNNQTVATIIAKYYDTDPATSAAWTVSALDSVEVGADTNTATSSDLFFCCAMVDYTPNNVVTSAGTSNGTSTVSAPGVGAAIGQATEGNNATVSGAGGCLALSVGVVSCSSTASAIGQSLALTVGSVAGQATVNGVSSTLALTVANASGQASVSGQSKALALTVGSVSGSSTASAIGQSLALTVGSCAGLSTVGGVGAALVKGTGSSAGKATVSGVGGCLALSVARSAGGTSGTISRYNSGLDNGSNNDDLRVDPVSNAFTLSNNFTVNSFTFSVWLSTPTDNISSLSWSIGTSSGASDIASGTISNPALVNQQSTGDLSAYYSTVSVSFSAVSLVASTYYLTLGGSASTNEGGICGWGQTSGGLDAYSIISPYSIQAVGKELALSVGNSAGTSTAQATSKGLALTVGSVSGQATVSGQSKALALATGNASGNASCNASGADLDSGTGSCVCFASVSGVAMAIVNAVGSSGGSCAVVGQSKALSTAIVSASGSSTGQATGKVIALASWNAVGQATVSGVSSLFVYGALATELELVDALETDLRLVDALETDLDLEDAMAG